MNIELVNHSLLGHHHEKYRYLDSLVSREHDSCPLCLGLIKECNQQDPEQVHIINPSQIASKQHTLLSQDFISFHSLMIQSLQIRLMIEAIRSIQDNIETKH